MSAGSHRTRGGIGSSSAGLLSIRWRFLKVRLPPSLPLGIRAARSSSPPLHPPGSSSGPGRPGPAGRPAPPPGPGAAPRGPAGGGKRSPALEQLLLLGGGGTRLDGRVVFVGGRKVGLRLLLHHHLLHGTEAPPGLCFAPGVG